MEIPSYDRGGDANSNFKQLFPFMPCEPFRMLVAGPSGGGKTNLLVHMLRAPLLYFDKIFIYGRNLVQEKYRDLRSVFDKIGKAVGYLVLECSSDVVLLEALEREAQKIVVFDDFVTDKNQGPLIEYFTGGRHKNCSCIYFSQSFAGTPKTIRLHCSHFCIIEFPSKRERGYIYNELGVTPSQYEEATSRPFDFLYVDKPKKVAARNFNGPL